MHEIPVLRDLVILVAVAIPVVIVAQRWRVPTVVGFLLTGIAIGQAGKWPVGRVAVRAAGAVIALAGGAFLTGLA